MRATLGIENGRPALRIDGRSIPPLAYATSFIEADEIRRFRRLGVNLVSFPATADFHLYGMTAPTWIGPQDYDHTPLAATMDAIAAANPDALLLPRVYTCAPPWWCDAHPEDLVVWGDGSRAKHLFHGAQDERVPSWASERWRRDSRENVRRLVRHVESGPHAHRVIGYMVTSGNSEEWFHWGVMEGYLFDYNPAMTGRFRSWLEKTYRTAAALSEAWGRDITFTAAEIPEPSRRRTFDRLGCRHPVADRDIVDFEIFFGELTAEVIIDAARTVKEATDGRKLFGTFYGYLTELAYHAHGIQEGGHVGLRDVLAEPNVDFLASPSSYARRLPADGYSMSMAPSTSLNRHGKVFFHENDVRTHVLDDDAGYGRTDTAFEDCGIQKRELAHALTHGHGMWWFDMTTGWYDHPALEATLATCVDVVRSAQHLPRRGVAEIAFVIDEESLHFCGHPPNRIAQLLCHQALELSRAGAPFDVLLFSDLAPEDRYRLLLFPDLFWLDSARRDRLREILADSGRTAVFLLAPGIIDEDSVDLAGVERACGIRLIEDGTARDAVIDAEIDGVRATYGTWAWHGHLPVIDEEGVTVLGRLRDGAAALARRTAEGWTSILSCAPSICGSLLARIATAAGVHRYVEGADAVYACSRFVAIHARTGGVKQITLPPGADDVLYDVENRVEIRAEGGRFEVYLPRAETGIYFRGDARAWDSLPPD